MKTKLIILFAVFGLITVGVLYVMYSRMSAENQTAQQVIADAEMGKSLRTLVETERSRCENLISLQKGGFGEYEYCKEFVEWGNAALITGNK